ncbi:hypothetical protein [Lapillicoccus jejuensis]|uniref:hypothetical protein n=1 Tax=Lapillicoccus jejuensis TaxID=402171 RepID=UPI00114F63B5|nr:hypothetical protein [Lapillicoccus jejuensis]
MDHPRLHLPPAPAPSLLGAPGSGSSSPPYGAGGVPGAWTSLLVHGSFFLATCTRCEWTGSARRARDTALRDGLRHRQACPGPAGPVPATAAAPAPW